MKKTVRWQFQIQKRKDGELVIGAAYDITDTNATDWNDNGVNGFWQVEVEYDED